MFRKGLRHLPNLNLQHSADVIMIEWLMEDWTTKKLCRYCMLMGRLGASFVCFMLLCNRLALHRQGFRALSLQLLALGSIKSSA
jgi:hypothetical protein